MYDDILVPTDGSEGVQETLRHAVDLARNHDATLHGLYVIDRRFELAAEEDRDEVIEKLTSRGQEAVSEVEASARAAGVDTTSSIREGIPYKAILSYADDNDVDVVVMGTHGRTGRDRLAHLGSVTERVVQHASVPVFVVNISEDEEAAESE